MMAGIAVMLGVWAPAAAQETRPNDVSGESLQVFLMTMGPGATVYERYGHNAIWIRDAATGTDLVYNYGTFDFAAPGFIMNFVKGRPRYWLGVSDLDGTLRQYTQAQRDVVVQELNLPAAKRAELAAYLATNASPENRVYTYDYFQDNCSTRVRDALDHVLGGALRTATVGQKAEGNFRFHTQRSLTNDVLMYTGIMLGQGPRTDRPIDQSEEMFLPAKLQERVRELTVTGPDGSVVPLVASERSLLEFGVYHVEPAPPAWGWKFQLAGLVIAMLIVTGLMRGGAQSLGRVMATLWLIVSGIGGLVLLFLWLGTDHVFSASNRNILFMSPLALFVVPLLWGRVVHGPSRLGVLAAAGMILSVVVGALLALAPSLGGQWNLQVMQLATLPGIAACLVALGVSYRRAGALPPPH
ncbi:MAG: DUF4105 domain-containing protein [Gemmatimonadales bacterium]